MPLIVAMYLLTCYGAGFDVTCVTCVTILLRHTCHSHVLLYDFYSILFLLIFKFVPTMFSLFDVCELVIKADHNTYSRHDCNLKYMQSYV